MPDWRHRGEYIETRAARKPGDTDILVAWADEAFSDPERLHADPDPASNTGRSARTIGFAHSAGFVVGVITVRDAGVLWGANAWKANHVDSRRDENQEER